jgi:hypothetical protein
MNWFTNGLLRFYFRNDIQKWFWPSVVFFMVIAMLVFRK